MDDMGSKECLKDKLARLLHLRNSVEGGSTDEQFPEADHALCLAIAKQLTESDDAGDLVALIQELIAVVEQTKLPAEVVELLWKRVSQLISDDCTLDEHRLTALEFLTTLTKVQYETLDKLRTSLCLLLINPRKLKCDAPPLLHLVRSLTKDGLDIRGFENHLGELVVQYMEFIPPASASSFAFMELLQGVVDHHTDTLDEKQICNVLTYVCMVTQDANSTAVKIICALNILDLVRSNAHLPSDCLAFAVHSLCKLVPRDDVFTYVWRTMQGLFNSSVGDAVIWHLCQIMQHIALGTGYIDMTLLQMARCVSSFPLTSSLQKLLSSVFSFYNHYSNEGGAEIFFCVMHSRLSMVRYRLSVCLSVCLLAFFFPSLIKMHKMAAVQPKKTEILHFKKIKTTAKSKVM